MSNWKSLFDDNTLREGEEYFRLGKAKKPSEDDEGFDVTVRGTRNYRIRIFDDGDSIYNMTCTCDESAGGKLCRHMAAALYLIEDVFEYELEADPEYAARYASKPSKGRKKTESAGAAAGKSSTSVSTQNSAAGRNSTPGSPADAGKSTSKRKNTASAKIIPIHPEGISNLSKLRKEDARARKAVLAESGADDLSLEAYRYFEASNVRNGLKIPKKTEREALELLVGGEVGTADFESGYYRYSNAGLKTGATQKEVYCIKVVQHSTSGKWYVSQLYDRDSLIDSRCHNWECHLEADPKSPVGHKLCKHEVATLFVVEDAFRSESFGDPTSPAAEKLIGRYRGGVISGEGAPLTKGTENILTLMPKLSIDASNHWNVRFQVGSKRLYLIKNFTEFLDDVRMHRERQYGKTARLQLGRECFDDNGLKWLTFIEKSVRTLRLFIGDSSESRDKIYYYELPGGWVELTDRIPLYGEILDHFFDAAGSDSIETERMIKTGWKMDKEKFFVRTASDELQLMFTLEPWMSPKGDVFDGVRLHGNVPEMVNGSNYLYLFENGTLRRISQQSTGKIRPLLEAAEGSQEINLKIGRSRLSEFYRKVLPGIREVARIEEVQPEIIERYLPAEPLFVCYLDVDDECVLLHPEVFYNAQNHTLFDVKKWDAHILVPEHYRDVVAEKEMFDFLEKYLPEHDEKDEIFLSQRGELPLFEFLDHGLSELMEVCEVRATERFMRLKVRKKVPFKMNVSLTHDLMNLELTSQDLSPEELLLAVEGYKKSAKYIRLKNGDFLRIDENEELARLKELLDTLQIPPKALLEEKLHIPAYRALYVDRMMELMDGVYADRDQHFKKLIKEFKTVSDSDFEVPESLQETLRKYQTVGYRWLRTLDEYHFGGILADDMGLGKTLQVITVLLAEHESETEHQTSLIVCPASLVYNWEAELKKFAPALHVQTVAGTQTERRRIIALGQEADVLVTSYDLLKRDIAEYEDISFRFEIVDEAQYIKNHTTAAAKCVKLIKARTRFALTGTPIENRLGELWSIFDYLMPGFLYDYNSFRSDFEVPIVKFGDGAVMDRLRRMAAPFMLRRKKNGVLRDLPDKLEEIRYAGFAKGGEQQKIYDAQVVRMRDDLMRQTDEDFKHNRIRILAELTRIRQICCDPALIYDEYDADSAKRDACMELLRSVVDGEHKALVFSQFTSMFAILKRELEAEGIAYYEITGATPKEERMRLVNTFNADATPVFLISLKAGGTGLNLVGADVVIHYDPWWNVAVQNQATDRAHRIGQTKVVTVYRLILRDTIEERIVEMQEKKRALAEDILSAEAVGSAAISREELLELLE